MSSIQFVVQIQSWDWPLHIGVKPRSVLDDLRRDGDFLCSEAIEIEGLVLSPQEHATKSIQFHLYPLPREVMFGGREKRDVGRLHRKPIERSELDFYASLFLPADTLHSVILCLNSRWQGLHMWVGDDAEPDAVTDFGFLGHARASSPAQPRGNQAWEAWLLVRGLIRQMTGGGAVIDASELSHDPGVKERTKREHRRWS